MHGIVVPHLTWAAETLRRQAMPVEEIRQVLAAEDLVTVHRYLELHRERLREQLVEEQHTVFTIERILTETRSTR
jgi:hypothetical protein